MLESVLKGFTTFIKTIILTVLFAIIQATLHKIQLFSKWYKFINCHFSLTQFCIYTVHYKISSSEAEIFILEIISTIFKV